MSPPLPWQPQHLVLEAEREHYAATRDCQERRVINVVSGSGALRTRPSVVALLLKKDSRQRKELRGRRDPFDAHGVDERLRTDGQIAVADVERWDEADRLIVRPAGDQKDIVLERSRDRGLAV